MEISIDNGESLVSKSAPTNMMASLSLDKLAISKTDEMISREYAGLDLEKTKLRKNRHNKLIEHFIEGYTYIVAPNILEIKDSILLLRCMAIDNVKTINMMCEHIAILPRKKAQSCIEWICQHTKVNKKSLQDYIAKIAAEPILA